MNTLQRHRGPDDQRIWCEERHVVGFAHQRLKIIDLEGGLQPMSDPFGNTVCFNGEIYNFEELKEELFDYPFRTQSDTEVVLAAYRRWGEDCVERFRGMFAFALWDEKKETLFFARDRFGIKPFYFTQIGDILYFASEVKTLMPFLPEIRTNLEALYDYFVFQLSLEKKTLFEGVHELPPAHTLTIKEGRLNHRKYWEVYYTLDFDRTRKYFEEKLEWLLYDSVKAHTRSDVPIGAYISGGIDSSAIASLAAKHRLNKEAPLVAFNGKFSVEKNFDESAFARAQAEQCGIELHEVDITADDFLNSIEKVIYHLDYPTAGPGSFPQYHVSKLASNHRKVVLGGQGGDEIFGGYARYLIAYFEQCIKAAIDGTSKNGNFIVTYESIIPNLTSLRNYKPLIKEFWSNGLFEEIDRRYYRLINRAPNLKSEVNWDVLPADYSPFRHFAEIFHGNNVGKESYFDMMTHFDFKTLLPALLQVEDRMSMAHGLESRVPLIDHKVVEFAATMPSNIKFENGTLKQILIQAVKGELCPEILGRKDKMGFPVPLNDWLKNDLREMVNDLFRSERIKDRPYFNRQEILKGLDSETKFGRKIWGLLSLELWHRQFHDDHHAFKQRLEQAEEPALT